MYRLLTVVLVCGCNSASETSHPDGSVDGKGIDGQFDGAVPTACNLTAPFGTPTPVPGVNSSSEDQWGWVSADGLTIYFDSVTSGQGDYNIYVGTRASTSDPFSGVMLLPGAGPNSADQENRPVVRGDGQEMFFQRTIGADGHIWSASRAGVTADFGTPALVMNVNSNAIDMSPWISDDGKTLYLATTNGGSNASDLNIVRATRPDLTTPFGAPMPVAELNMANAVDNSPVLSADGLEIFFASTRGLAGVSPRNDIWHATRATATAAFGTPQKVTELSIADLNDYPNWVSADRCTLLFTSERTGGNGGYDIWMAKRPQ